MSSQNLSAAQQQMMEREIQKATSAAQQAIAHANSARGIMEVVRASNFIPPVPAYIAWSPDIRREKHRAELAMQTAAKKLVQNELKRLDALFETVPEEEFQRALGTFQRDLRYIGPIASNVMREASTHMHVNYRLRKKEHPCEIDGMKIFAVTTSRPLDRITEGDLKKGEVLFLDSFQQPNSRDEGRIHAGTRLANGGVLILYWHGGRSAFAVRDESKPLSQQETFGRLDEALATFEHRIGTKLPAIKVYEMGVGIWEAHGRMYAQHPTENPWHLEPGQHYEVTSPGGTARTYLANEDSTVTQLHVDSAYPIRPRAHWGETEWKSLRKVEQTETLTERERG